MTQDAGWKRPPKSPAAPKAEHGDRSEVNWDGGRGRQPYPNQETPADAGPAATHEFEGGDRGDVSGRNQEQMEQVRRK